LKLEQSAFLSVFEMFRTSRHCFRPHHLSRSLPISAFHFGLWLKLAIPYRFSVPESLVSLSLKGILSYYSSADCHLIIELRGFLSLWNDLSFTIACETPDLSRLSDETSILCY